MVSMKEESDSGRWGQPAPSVSKKGEESASF